MEGKLDGSYSFPFVHIALNLTARTTSVRHYPDIILRKLFYLQYRYTL